MKDPDDAALAKTIGTRVRERRSALDLSQAELAELVEMSVDHISMLERGKRMPSVPALRRLASRLKMSSDQILGLLQRSDAWVAEAAALLPEITERDAALSMLKSLVQTAKESDRPQARRRRVR